MLERTPRLVPVTRASLGLLCLALACATAKPPLRATESAPEPLPAPPPAAPPAAPAPPVEAAAPAPARWGWVLPVDHGIRADKGGAGGFLAPRAHGSHNGVDLLAPLGTPVRAPCAGKARAGQNSSHGKWVQLVCPLPSGLGLAPGRRVSLFFAHLSDVAGLGDSPADVAGGASLGAVGKTGNASAAIVAAHLHFEASVHDDEAGALAERHSGRDQSDTQAAHELDEALRARCLGPAGLKQKAARLWRARRADPFVLLTCLGADKPGYTRPAGKLGEASYAWSSEYSATGFDVDSGVFRSDGAR